MESYINPAGDVNLPAIYLSDHLEIIVVDDDLAMQRLLVDFLDVLGYETLGFRSPLGALNYLRGTSFQNRGPRRIVISDVNMPLMDGFEFMECLKAMGSGVPTILISAFGVGNYNHRAMASGAAGFLNKPFPLQDLAAIIRSLDQDSVRHSAHIHQ